MSLVSLSETGIYESDMSVRYGQTNHSQGSLFWHHEATNLSQGTVLASLFDHCFSDPLDRFVSPYLSLMKDSFSCTHFCANALIKYNFTLKFAAHSRQP